MIEALLAGDVRALARAISLVEEQAERAAPLLAEAYPHSGRAAIVGLTGSPGTGKSTLVDRLIAGYRREDRRVGVVAVDPSSAFSGGAVLGDRVRMQAHATDPAVFIRSMATRGQLGGLARAANDAVDLIDAAGYDPILIETVGVGQDEIDIVRTADVVVVVLVPGMGDDIQAIKAGILEIADLFVINKSDREGADRLAADLEAMLALAPGDAPRPAILRTVAVRDEGIDGLREAVVSFLHSRGLARRQARRRERAEMRLRALVSERVLGRLFDPDAPGSDGLAHLVSEVAERRLDPYRAAEQLLARMEAR
jgi:LAO/AO transport system kinase